DAGLVPMLAAGSAGTANAGSIDPLVDLAGVCRESRIWFHVDGAYGAPAAMTDGHAFLREGFALADSLSLDPHKWLFAPFDTGALLVRPAGAARRVHGTRRLHRGHRDRSAGSARVLRPRHGTVAALPRAEAVDHVQAARRRYVSTRDRRQHRLARIPGRAGGRRAAARAPGLGLEHQLLPLSSRRGRCGDAGPPQCGHPAAPRRKRRNRAVADHARWP